MQNHNIKAILILLLALMMFMVSDSLVKSLTLALPALQLTLLRGLASAIGIGLVILVRGRVNQLKTAYPKQHLLRAVIFTLLSLGYILALREYPLTLVAAAFSAAPLLITAAAPWLLNERVSALQWIAVTTGFLGVLFILRPDVSSLDPSVMIVLLIPFGYAFLLLISKKMTEQESGWVLNFYSFLGTIIALLPWGLMEWVPLTSRQWFLVIASALAGMLGLVLLTHAFHLGRAAVVAPFEYAALLMALLLDMVFWQIVPDGLAVTGVCLVLLCGGFQVFDATRRPSLPVSHTVHTRLMDTHPDDLPAD